MSALVAGSGRNAPALRAELVSAVRTLGTVTLVGIGVGIVSVGVLSRLAMSLLAALNPEAAGITSDDGFAIGQVTIGGSLNLALLAGPFLGVLSAGCWVALRDLRVGPGWFRWLSFCLGPAIVVAAVVVHTGGVDFVRLQPLWLAVTLFVAVPAVHVALLTLVAERVLVAHPHPPWFVTALGLLAWAPLLPVLVAVGVAWLVCARAPATAARVVLSGVFVVAVVDLGRDLSVLG